MYVCMQQDDVVEQGVQDMCVCEKRFFMRISPLPSVTNLLCEELLVVRVGMKLLGETRAALQSGFCVPGCWGRFASSLGLEVGREGAKR